MTGKNCVYFYYDAEGNLLYIGKAVDAGARWSGHREHWMKDVCKVGLIECPDRAGMDVLESYCIVKMPSKYNKVGLEHGYTKLELYDIGSQTMYTVEEFKKVFVKKETAVEEEKLRRINLAIPRDVYEFIRRQSRKEGLTYAQFLTKRVYEFAERGESIV